MITSPIVVVGSGPGGAITAACLAEAGREVVLIEEGSNLPLDSAPHFSLEEMGQKYRNGGITVCMGNAKVAYVEGRVVGGGSEINRGMYHRIHGEVLEQWHREFGVAGIGMDELLPHFEACEQVAKVSDLPVAAPLVSMKLHEGATSLGWKSRQVLRLVQYQSDDHGRIVGHKESMSATWIPRFLAAGGRLISDTRVSRIKRQAGKWQLEGVTRGAANSRVSITADRLILACGAIHTPALLQRSGITKNVGSSLRFHPMLKVIAKFREEVNPPGGIEPVHQVIEFDPRFSMGASVSLKPLLALSMLDHPAHRGDVDRYHRHMGIYYVQTTTGRATVRSLPGYLDPLVQTHMTPADLSELGAGLRKLCEALFAAGAIAIYPGVAGYPVLHGLHDLDRLPTTLPPAQARISTLHVFSSCRMGEDRSRCVTDSYGRVFGADNLHIADASLLCGPTIVNPQGTVMAVAHRNVKHLISESTRP
jgi:choline dehydrogenase-like flavoprotein